MIVIFIKITSITLKSTQKHPNIDFNKCQKQAYPFGQSPSPSSSSFCFLFFIFFFLSSFFFILRFGFYSIAAEYKNGQVKLRQQPSATVLNK